MAPTHRTPAPPTEVRPQTAAAPAPTTPSADSLPDAITAPVERIDAYMLGCIDAFELPENLAAAMRYALLGPGKRVRPLLAWHACAAVGGDPTASLPAAAAIEMVHAFSLVHDDLPGMDNDDLRRGRPTLHRHTSEAMAILAGDALLTLPFGLLTERIADPAALRLLVQELSSGTMAMIAGQVYDTLGGFPTGDEGQTLAPAARLLLVHKNKTGALIRAACRMGAICGNPQAADSIRRLTYHGEAIGLMFQIIDDLLDVTQTTAHLGKRAGKDHEAGKLTYPGVMGIERSREEVARLHQEAVAVLEPFGPEADALRQLCAYMAVRSR